LEVDMSNLPAFLEALVEQARYTVRPYADLDDVRAAYLEIMHDNPYTTPQEALNAAYAAVIAAQERAA
jgi:DNA gyrase inhibitor GyrI